MHCLSEESRWVTDTLFVDPKMSETAVYEAHPRTDKWVMRVKSDREAYRILRNAGLDRAGARRQIMISNGTYYSR